MKTHRLFKFLFSILLPLAVGAVAGLFTSKAVPGWYASINRPSFSPPNWVFAPVWTSLYIIMGISFFIIWSCPPGKERKRAITFYLAQLLLNFLWSFLFFYFKQIGWALAEITLLWVMIVVMIVSFYRLKPSAAYLNFSYLLWVTFASVLNGAYFILN